MRIYILIVAALAASEAAGAATLTVNAATALTDSVAYQGTDSHSFSALATWRYNVCVAPSTGDTDLYGSTGSVSRTLFQTKSTNANTTPDCIAYTATTSGTYNVAVYGYSASNYVIYVVGYDQDQVPTWLKDKIATPFHYPGIGPWRIPQVTFPAYGPFGSPWGNAQAGSTPFFADGKNKFHTAVDFTATPNEKVYNVYDGVVKLIGSSSTDGSWGYYANVEHNIDGNLLCTSYTHLNFAGRPAVGATVRQGDVIGTIFDMNVAGEVDHLHFAVQLGACRTTAPKPQGGALSYAEWGQWVTGTFINPDPKTNPGLYGDIP